MTKENQFIDWLCGKDVEFPYFKTFPNVPQPDTRTLYERNHTETQPDFAREDALDDAEGRN